MLAHLPSFRLAWSSGALTKLGPLLATSQVLCRSNYSLSRSTVYFEIPELIKITRLSYETHNTETLNPVCLSVADSVKIVVIHVFVDLA